MRTKKQKIDKYNAACLPFIHLPEAVKSELRAVCPCRLQEYNELTRRWSRPVHSEDFSSADWFPFEQGTPYRVKPDPVVTIDVQGGVAYVRGNPRNVTVRIIDHDNREGILRGRRCR